MPMIGLLSDSHGHAPRTQAAVALLRDAGAEMLLHLGDLGTIEVIDALAVDWAESRMVLGNTDWDALALTQYARDLGIRVDHPAGTLDLGDDRSLVFTHGHLQKAVDRAMSRGVTYLCHGHTHQECDQMVGRTRVINPGALTRAARYTVALLDTDADRLTFHVVDKC